MPDITIIKLKIRRGTDNQRKTIVLEQGELGYSTDTRRVFVGDGITVGGVPVSNVNHSPISSPSALTAQRNAVVNDFVFAGTYLYQLTASDYSSLSSWSRISNNLEADDNSIGYTTVNGVDFLRIKDGGITGSMFNSSAAYNLGGLSATNSGLRANVDNSTLFVTNSNLLSVYKIDNSHMSKDSFTLGITGGEGEKVRLSTDSEFFSFTGDGRLTLIDVPDGSVTISKLGDIIGDGLYPAGDKIAASIQSIVLSGGLTDDGNGNISIANTINPDDSFFKTLAFNTHGQIISSAQTISTVLSCNTTVPELAIFNGSPSQITFGASYTNQTLLTALSTNSQSLTSTEQITLSSAGFITFESTAARDGMPVSRFAVPIFTY